MGALALSLAWQWWRPLDELVNSSRVWSAGLPLALLVCAFATLERHSAASTARGVGAARRAAISHAMGRLGDWSYALYLTHYPVMLLCLKLFRGVVPQPSEVQALSYFVLTAVVAVAVAAALHHGFEKPVQRWLGQPGRRTQQARPASATS